MDSPRWIKTLGRLGSKGEEKFLISASAAKYITLSALVIRTTVSTFSLLLGAATASDVQLLSRDPFPPPEKPGPELLIPVTDVDLKAGEYERMRKSSGDAVWIPAGRKHTFLNATADPARFIVVQFKAPAKD